MSSMAKLILAFILTFASLITHAQSDISQYLKTHNYSFSLDKGFDDATSDTLKKRLSNYKLVILGEGGSHFLQFYNPLRFIFIKFLSNHFGMTHFFMETGHSTDILWNKFLETGDTSYLPTYRNQRSINFWTNLYSYNAVSPKSKTITPSGIDFERIYSYCKALKLLLPNSIPPDKIKNSIDLIKNANDTLYDCDYILNLNSQLKEELEKNKTDFQKYFSINFNDFNLIINNNGDCKDALKDRNINMAKNLLQFDNVFNDSIYYLQIGMAHSTLLYKNAASYINNASKFKDKVCVINTYCYNCSTAEEQVSNWQLHKIDTDILQKLLPYCTTDFTLFDFSEDSKMTRKFKVYGQFLLIAKNQN